jgi:hypothetical protein
MSKVRRPRLPKVLLDELEGHDWELRPGRRHWQLWVGGRLATLWSYGTRNEAPAHGPIAANTCAAVRRALRRLKLAGL